MLLFLPFRIMQGKRPFGIGLNLMGRLERLVILITGKSVEVREFLTVVGACRNTITPIDQPAKSDRTLVQQQVLHLDSSTPPLTAEGLAKRTVFERAGLLSGSSLRTMKLVMPLLVKTLCRS